MMQEVRAGSRQPWVGLANTFPLYSHSLKFVLGYNQRQLNMLGVAIDIGNYFGALMAGFVSGRFRPWVLLLAGAACWFFGFGVVWLAFTHIVTGLPFWVLCIALCIGTNGSAWLITGVRETNIRNFPICRGTFSVMLKGYVGLSASVFIGLYAGIFPRSSLLLFLAVGLPAICLAVMYFVPSLVEDSSDVLGNLQEIEDIVMPLAVGEGAAMRMRRRPWMKADFWLLFLAFFIGARSGVTVLNNLAQIGVAVGADDPKILLCVFNLCNFLGRLGGGAVSEHFVRTRMLPRSIWMICTQLIMIIAFLLYALGLRSTLDASTAMLGICYGVQTAMMVPTLSDLFGLEHFGTIFNFMQLGRPLGAFLFSGLLAGYLYDQEAAKQHPHSSTSCLGPSCFRLTFLVLAGLCGLGTLLSLILTVRLRPVYQMLFTLA